jgi:Flp pilus assembly protein TadG
MRQGQAGQALFETALIIPVMLSLIVAALVVGQLLISSLTVQHAVRAAVEQAALSGGDRQRTEQAARTVLVGGIGMQRGTATVTVQCDQTPCRRYGSVTVALEYRDRYWVPVNLLSIAPEYTLAVSATRLLERDQP